MLRVIIATLAFVILGSALCAGAVPPTASTGFSDPDRIISIDEFRLPSWGYRTLELGFGLSGMGNTSDDPYKVESTNGSIDVSPQFEWYRESEQRVKHLNLRLDGRWRASRFTDEDTRYPSESKNRHVELVTGIESEWKRYFRPSHFFTITGDGWGVHQVRHTEKRRSKRDKEVRDRTYNAYEAALGVGFGFGRVRNVTPVVRALRLGERLEALGKIPRLSDEEIRRVADQFAVRSGYSRIHNRSNKYFWEDLTDVIAGIDSLTAFEVYYLSEVLIEKIGDRLEGWETAAGLSLRSSEYEGDDRNALLSGFTRASWYKNHTLDHQTGLEISGEVGKHIDGSLEWGPEGSVRLFANHLWVIADRLVWEPNLSGTVSFLEVEATEGRDAWWKTRQTYSLASAFTFFIEDRMALTSSGTFSIERRDHESYQGDRRVRIETHWHLSLTLAYYLDRVLSL